LNVKKDSNADFSDQLSEKAKILIVDDRPDKLLAMESVLEGLGTDVIRANSGQEALRLLLRFDFALILLDVSMPEMDGFETASLIRQRKRSEHTPIIFVTSINTTETHVTRGYSLGAVDYIFSPIQQEVLRAKASVFIDLFRKNLQVKKQSELLRIEAERRADSLENRLQTLLNNLGVGVFRISSAGELLEANPAFLELLSVDSIEQAAQHELYRTNFASGVTELINGRLPVGVWKDFEWDKKDGNSRWFSFTRTISHDEKGNSFIEGLVDDITPRKKAENELKTLNDNLEQTIIERTAELKVSEAAARRSERLASLGTLAAGIAHEINNPLNSILMATQFGCRHINDPSVISETLRIIQEETKRCGKIVKGVLQFARDERKAKTATDLNEVVISAVDLARMYVKTVMQIDFRLAQTPLLANVNSTEIEQVLINLIQNSAEANPKNAQIEIKLSVSENSALISVKDNGPGISEEDQLKIFDPFYSTKTDKGGTGLGLSVAHGIVIEHGGNIRVQSVLGEGTTFEINFPLYRASKHGASSAAERAREQKILELKNV
jgi:PAS domain S-box-containing protein